MARAAPLRVKAAAAVPAARRRTGGGRVQVAQRRGDSTRALRRFPCEDWASPHELAAALRHGCARAPRSGLAQRRGAKRHVESVGSAARRVRGVEAQRVPAPAAAADGGGAIVPRAVLPAVPTSPRGVECATMAVAATTDAVVQVDRTAERERELDRQERSRATQVLREVAHCALRQAWDDVKRTMKRPSAMIIVRMRCYTFGVVDALYPGAFRMHGPRGGRSPRKQTLLLASPQDLDPLRAVLGAEFDVARPDAFDRRHFEIQVDDEHPVRVVFRPTPMTLKIELLKAHVFDCGGVTHRWVTALAAVDRERARVRARLAQERRRRRENLRSIWDRHPV